MKVERYYAEDIDFELWADVQLVSATDYDALLELARELRSALVRAMDTPNGEGRSTLDKSAWLEE